MAPALFDQVVAASRLNRLVAPFTVSRLLTRAGVLPNDLTGEGLLAALPHLEHGLALYLDADELREALRDIRRLAEQQ